MDTLSTPRVTSPAHEPPTGAARRWILFWNVSAYIVLIATGIVAWLDPDLTFQQHLIATALGLTWGGWYWVFIVRYARWVDRKVVLVISYIASIAVAGALTLIHPAFLAILFSYFGLTFGIFSVRIAIPIIILLTVTLILRFILASAGSGGNLSIILGFTGYGIGAIIMGLYFYSIIAENRKRRHMIEELQATRNELAKAERQAGVLQERQRLAGEIHDTLAQGFTSIIMHLEAADQAFDTNPYQARQYVLQARQSARDNLAEARRVLWALRPDVLEREPFTQAVQRIARQWSEECKIPAPLSITGALCPLPADHEVTLLRAVQEALANVRKHAQASKVNITLSFMDDEVILDVHDDGKGFDLRQAGEETGQEKSGYGLAAMRTRVEQSGGSFTIESAPREGTTVVIQLPFNPQEVK